MASYPVTSDSAKLALNVTIMTQAYCSRSPGSNFSQQFIQLNVTKQIIYFPITTIGVVFNVQAELIRILTGDTRHHG